MRFDGRKTLKQIGDKFNISRERVRQILNKNGGSGGHELLHKTVKIKEFNCLNCKTIFLRRGNIEYKYCSKKCCVENLYPNRSRCLMCKKRKRVNKSWCKKCNTIRAREYRKTLRGKEVFKQIRIRAAKKYPEKYRARTILNSFVSMGKIIKPDNCSNCLLKAKLIDAHHHDYSKPLEVIWYCRSCHVKLHRGSVNN